MNKQKISAMAFAALGMVGTFLPWVELPILGSISGTAGDGWISLFLYLISLAIAFAGDRNTEFSLAKWIAYSVPAALGSALGIWKIMEFTDKLGGTGFFGVELGIGLYLVAFSGILGVLTAKVLK